MLWRFSYFFWLRPPALTFAGYLANWKIFEPRKLMPLSIELWSAPIAVMTEITEKTPIVIPVMVNADRNLFAPREESAMAMISRNLMALDAPERTQGTPRLKAHSYRRAVTGSR